MGDKFCNDLNWADKNSVEDDLYEGYRAMAADCVSETEARRAESTCGDTGDEES
ncbi:MAG: hypothetical protein R6V62_11020 [Candidatus Fermentibacteraceae bacterium]